MRPNLSSTRPVVVTVAALMALSSCNADSSGVDEVQSALAGTSVPCLAPPTALPAGYPQRIGCHSNGGLIAACTCYPADVTSTDKVPYQVVTILYAPPGNMSSISYASGSTVGTSEQITRTNQLGSAISVEAGAVTADGKWTDGLVTGTQDVMQTINTSSIGVAQSQDIPNHAYDTFYIWLNPLLNGTLSGITAKVSAAMVPQSVMWSATGAQVSSLGSEGKPRMQIEAISANALANPSARTPSEQGFFGHLTSAQIAQILTLDDFYSNPNFDPAANPKAYRYVTSLSLNGPEQGSPVTPNSGATIEYDSQHDPIDGTASHAETTVQVGPSFSFLGIADFSVKFGPAYTFDYNDARTTIQGVQKAANIVVQSSTPCLHANVDMYLDLRVGSWVAQPTYTNYSCSKFGAWGLAWGGGFYGTHGTFLGDVDGDGKKDMVGVGDGYIGVIRSQGSTFSPTYETWLSNQNFFGSHGTLVGDIDGDGKADVVNLNDGSVTAKRSNGRTFGATEQWWGGAFYGTHGTFLADVDGDKKADLVGLGDGYVGVARSTGAGFGTYETWLNGSFYGAYGTYVADVDGDKKADLVGLGNGYVAVMQSSGTGFVNYQTWMNKTFSGTHGTLVDDVTGDGRADLVALNDNAVLVAPAPATGFAAPMARFAPPVSWWNGGFFGSVGALTLIGDVTGDGRADLVDMGPSAVGEIDVVP
jgi:FG-GAP-like repeat